MERKDEFKFCCPGHNGAPISREYIQDFIGLSDSILNGTAVIENELHHPYIEASPEGPYLCRARYGHASFFVKKEDIAK